MQLVILDPNLEAESGHHLFYDSSLAAEAKARGWSVTILANIRFPKHEIGGVPVIPHFRVNGYPAPPTDIVRGRYDNFKERNDSIFEDLCALPQDLFAPGCLVHMPTVNENQLYGIMRWCELFNPASSPLFAVWLMLPSGVHVEGETLNEMKLLDPVQALLYRFALDIGKSLGGRCIFFGSGNAHAREYAAISGLPIEPHPIIMNIDPSTQLARNKGRPRILLFAGDAKIDKGLALVPDLARLLRKRNPDWKVVIHANFTTAWGASLELQPAFEALAAEDPDIEMRLKMISRSEYAQMIQSCDVAAFTYDPVEYKRKSSGVLWEAIALGLPVVAPADTWLYEEVEEWRGVVSGYTEWTAESIADAVDQIIPAFGGLQKMAEKAGRRFRERNNVASAVDQLMDAWLQSTWLRSGMLTEHDVVQPLGSIEGPGWSFLEQVMGRPARWVGPNASWTVQLPPALEWLVRIDGVGAISKDVCDSAELHIGGQRLDTTCRQMVDGSWTIAGRWVPPRTPHAFIGKARTELQLRSKFGVVPDGETRELSLLVTSVTFLNPQTISEQRRGAETLAAHIVFDRGEVAPAQLSENQDGLRFRVGRVVAGSTRFMVPCDAIMHFEVNRLFDDRDLAKLRVLVNGVSLPVEAKPGLEGSSVTVAVPRSILLDAGGKVTVEIHLPDVDTLAPLKRLARDPNASNDDELIVMNARIQPTLLAPVTS